APALTEARRVVPFLYGTRDPHIGQLTRVILPFLVTEATMWPRSSLHVTHICSTRSPVLTICISSMLLLYLMQSVSFFRRSTARYRRRSYLSRATRTKRAHGALARCVKVRKR